MMREILALGLSNDMERIGVKTALCFGLSGNRKGQVLEINRLT